MNLTQAWHIPSNSGRDTLNFVLAGILKRESAVAFNIILSSQRYSTQEQSPLTKEFVDYSFNIPAVVIHTDKLHLLTTCFEQWLTDNSPFSIVLADSPGYSLRIKAKKSRHLISSLTKPVLSIDFQHSALQLRNKYVADFSCINMAATELRAILSHYHNSDGLNSGC